ncbi:MAG TPA: hypothetical protein VJS39_04540 [Gemmatimonadaceae bacterium]|nr:hypothetical protein [Gemmatimonadaceae bacterium]
MPITATYDHQHRRVLATAVGRISLDEIRSHLEEERQEPALGYSEMVDARGAVPDFPPADVRILVAWLRWLGEKTRLGPTAVIVDTDFAFGMARIIESLVDDVALVKPFRDKLDAELWLDAVVEAQG